jgi:DNA-binding XRE family transcriptional regulator
VKERGKMLSSNQLKAIELLAYSFMTQEEVSQKLKIHRNTITNWKKNEEFSKALDREVRKSLNNTGVMALRVIVGLLNSQKEEMRFRAAKDILDRIGYKTIVSTKMETKYEDVVMSIDEYRKILGDEVIDSIFADDSY